MIQYVHTAIIVDKLSENPSRRGVINLSLGVHGFESQKSSYESYFGQMIENGGIPVAAAGNNGIPACFHSSGGDTWYFVPATAENCISVGATQMNGKKVYLVIMEHVLMYMDQAPIFGQQYMTVRYQRYAL